MYIVLLTFFQLLKKDTMGQIWLSGHRLPTSIPEIKLATDSCEVDYILYCLSYRIYKFYCIHLSLIEMTSAVPENGKI